MQFSKLRLAGFKSFVEPTDFEIHPGLTGVIGPNGCGKSNLVEALRWVMGENSYKSMRASGMDDVIFAGGGDRPARNVAEVGLTLDNSARSVAATFNDADVLEVSRRIEREHGSTYRINGREVRARDVQILFADASTGSRSPSLVRQGQISEIIAAKPQARRRILEEAAGVAGLHTRRHEAELRLKGAEDNLARIDDVLGQIAAQGDGLRRQARQAQRYKEVQADIRRLQALSMLLDWEAAKKEEADARKRLAAAEATVVEATRAQAEAGRRQAVAAQALPPLREQEGEASRHLQRLVVARETLDGEERRAKGRQAEVERRLTEIEADLARDAGALDDAERAVVRLDAEAGDLASQADGTDIETSLREKLAAAEAARAKAEVKLAELQTARADAFARRRELEERSRQDAQRLAASERALADAVRSRTFLAERLVLNGQLEQAADQLRQATEAAATADEAARQAERQLAEAREAETQGRAPLSEADRRTQRLEAEVRTLAKLLDAGSGGKWRPILDAVAVSKGYEAALGAALGDDLEVSDNPASAAHWVQVPGGGDGALPEGAIALIGYVDAPAALQRRLMQIGIVAQADGPALRNQLRPGQRLVSLEGDLWRWDGFTRQEGATTPAARLLVERNRLSDIRGDAAAARELFDSLRAAADSALDVLRDASATDLSARAEVKKVRQQPENARSTHAALERRFNEMRAQTATVEATEAAARSARDEAARRKVETEAALAALPPADSLAAALVAAADAAATQRESETEIRATWQAITRERAARMRRLDAIASERQSWVKRAAQAAAHRADLEVRLNQAREEYNTLVEAPDAFVLSKRQIRSDIEVAETALRAAGDARAVAESALATADKQARAMLDAMTVAREEKARAEAQNEAAGQRLDSVVRAIAIELECGPPALPGLAKIRTDEARPPAADVDNRLESLKSDRERLGAVNLRADEELASLEEQRAALDKEKADLAEAVRRLRQAIGSLNKEGRERLLGAFDQVNDHFKELFTKLFGGGTAELQLVESDDPLEAGLEIVARPPGKKPQVMTLLSGGEQALTAISLIFAVFLTNPSPVCVLDEVDAPLDDANVERFCDLVDAMRQKTETRFIVITHNPITMARMDRLYGVTQAERGISQLVSVALAEAERILEAS